MNIFIVLLWVVAPVGGVALLVLAALTIRVVPENRRLVVFRGGQYAGTRGPGTTLVLPLYETVTAVEMHEQMRSWETFSNPTRDGGRVSASLDCYTKVIDPQRAAAEPADDSRLQAVVVDAFAERVRGQTLAEALHDPRLAEAVRGRVAERAGAWGLEVTTVKVRGIRAG